MSPVATRKAVEETADTDRDPGWRTVLFNCECHTFDQVERILMKATRCSLSQARAWSFEVDSKGSATVFEGPRERCEAVADVIGSIGLVVNVTR